MATWKKVIVSVSNGQFTSITASQVPGGSTENVLVITTTGEIRQVTQGTLTGQSIKAFSTASAGGAQLLADSANGNLTFASSSGQGLTISGNSGTDTITFGLSSIPNSSLANSTISGVSLGSNLNALTLGAGLNGSSYNGSAAVVASVDSGSMLPYYSSSIFSRVSGDILINSSTGVATIQTNSVALGTDTTGDYVQNLGAGTGVTIGSNSGEASQPTIAVIYGSTSNTAVQGNANITINGTTNEIEITGTAAQALGGGPSYTIGLPNDVTITGNLTVNGTTTTIDTTNLLVEDKFIILAHGSGSISPIAEGGIIVEGSTADKGQAFLFNSGSTENVTGRWGLAADVHMTSSNVTPTDFMVSAFQNAGAPSSAPTYGGSAGGYGNIYVNSSDESIWIFS